jgi:hypothetical protein
MKKGNERKVCQKEDQETKRKQNIHRIDRQHIVIYIEVRVLFSCIFSFLLLSLHFTKSISFMNEKKIKHRKEKKKRRRTTGVLENPCDEKEEVVEKTQLLSRTSKETIEVTRDNWKRE